MDLLLRSFSFATMTLLVGAKILETKDDMSHKQVIHNFRFYIEF